MFKKLLIWLSCRIGRHNWEVPTESCGDHSYKRHGTRQCTHCDRLEFLTISMKTGEATWHCTSAELKFKFKT